MIKWKPYSFEILILFRMSDNSLLTVHPRLFVPFRIHIMSILNQRSEISFIELRDKLKINNGNLVSHFRFLIGEGFVAFQKNINGHKVSTIYTITEKGRREYQRFRDLMLEVLN
jgi:DNA-binding MarR family transcriptional regulator